MVAFNIKLDSKPEFIAGKNDISLIHLFLGGGKSAEVYLNVSGIKALENGRDEHVTWLEERIGIGENITIKITQSGDYSSPIRSRFASLDEIKENIQKIFNRINAQPKSKKRRKPLTEMYLNLIYEIDINDDQKIITGISDFDNLQLNLIWHEKQDKVFLKVHSSKNKDNASMMWVDKKLDVGDIIRINVRCR